MLQGVHADCDDAPVDVLNLPVPQSWQVEGDVAPMEVLNLPDTQASHVEEGVLALLYLPAGQAEHVRPNGEPER